MRKNVFYWVVVFFILSLLFVSCRNKGSGEVVDVLSYFDILEKIEPTYLIDLTSPQSGDYLLRGWSHFEKTHRWVEGLESQFVFYGFQEGSAQKDTEMTIKCVPFIFPGSPEQSIKIYLNGQFLKKISLSSSWSDYKVNLPGKLLKAKNMMMFKYAYAEKPSNRLVKSKDQRRLSAGFSRIQFDCGIKWDKANYQKDKNIIIQYPASIINYYFEAHINSKIRFDYKITGDTKPYVEFMFDDGQTEKIDVSPHASKLVYNVPKGNGRIVKMSLVVPFGNQASKIVWKSIKIDYPERESSLVNSKKVEKGQSVQKTVLHNKPDIFLYVVDALRSDHLSCYGYSRKTSPSLDKFAQENTLFLNAYANASWTRASGATMLTGLLPKKHKTMARDSSLPPDLKTLQEILKENGYYTIAFITNGNLWKGFGFNQGFDEFVEIDYQNKNISARSDRLNDNVFKFLEGFMNSKDRKPVFAFIWSMDPHDPYIPDKSVSHEFGIDQYSSVEFKSDLMKKLLDGPLKPTESQLQYIKTLYDQEILFNDRSFGHFLNKLRQKNIYGDSIIIFTADHGEEFRDHGAYGHIRTLYNEVIKIPFVIKGKRIKRGVIKDTVQHADLVPTLLDILDIKLPYEVDGVSLMELERSGDRCIFGQAQVELNDVYMVLFNGYKFIYNIESYRPPLGGGIVPRYELYDLGTDMEERYNLAESQPLQKGYLLQILKSFINSRDNTIKVEEKKVTLTPELDRQLRDLGYVK